MSTNPSAAALLAQVAVLRSQADAIEAIARSLEPEDDLGVDDCREIFGVGRDAIKSAAARGELEVTRGVRGKLLVKRSALQAWLASKPYVPPARDEPAQDAEAWQRSVLRKGAA
ncbi:MAG: hypothetical protein ABI548_00115 [Polyangiaceae bacterium]